MFFLDIDFKDTPFFNGEDPTNEDNFEEFLVWVRDKIAATYSVFPWHFMNVSGG